MKQNHLQTFSLFSLFLLASCAYRVDKNPQQNLQPANEKLNAPLTFKLIQTSVLEAKCIECHSNATKNSGHLNLETYQNVLAAIPDIKEDISQGVMPKSPELPLTDEEKFLVMTWIEMGAPETAPVADPVPAPSEPTQTPTPTPAPTQTPVPAPAADLPVPGLLPTFTSINNLILKAKCLDCHNSSGSASDVPFEQYSDLVSGDIVVPGSAAKSSLIKHITSGAKKIMPPVKSKYKMIAPEDVSIISDWINSGALNN